MTLATDDREFTEILVECDDDRASFEGMRQNRGISRVARPIADVIDVMAFTDEGGLR